MVFINRTYFTTDNFIPNLDECGHSIDGLIAQKEKEALCLALGNCVADELFEQMEFSETESKYILKATADEKWDWLINGKTFDKELTNGYQLSNIFLNSCGCGCNNSHCPKVVWKGLTSTTAVQLSPTKILEQKESLLADYTYYHWTINMNTITTGTGEQAADVKGSVRMSNHIKGVRAYNRYVGKVAGCNRKCYASLSQFMYAHQDLFPEFEAGCFKYKAII